MAKNKDQKKKLLKSYKDQISNSKGLIVLKPSKITPNEANDFRKELYDFGSSLNVVKNSIFKIALKESNLELPSVDKGEYAVLFLSEDIATPSKLLKKFVESTKNKAGDVRMEIISGILDNAVLTKEQVVELSEMPDTKGSISMILGILDNALSGVIYVLDDAPRSVASILDQAFKE